MEKYAVIENFLTQEEIDLLTKYTKIVHRINYKDLDKYNEVQNNLITAFYADPIMESLLFNKKKKVELTTNKKLFNTYSYWRMYTQFCDLKEHKDRPSCEISVTAMIGSDGTDWPIYMDGVPIVLKPGQACVYKGCEVSHYREEFLGDWNAQVFLHYVDSEGPNKNYVLDKRPYLGTPKIYY